MRRLERSVGDSGDDDQSSLSLLSLFSHNSPTFPLPFFDRELLGGHAHGLGRRGGVRGHRFVESEGERKVRFVSRASRLSKSFFFRRPTQVSTKGRAGKKKKKKKKNVSSLHPVFFFEASQARNELFFCSHRASTA